MSIKLFSLFCRLYCLAVAFLNQDALGVALVVDASAADVEYQFCGVDRSVYAVDARHVVGFNIGSSIGQSYVISPGLFFPFIYCGMKSIGPGL